MAAPQHSFRRDASRSSPMGSAKMCNLLHLAHERGFILERVLDRARSRFVAEEEETVQRIEEA